MANLKGAIDFVANGKELAKQTFRINYLEFEGEIEKINAEFRGGNQTVLDKCREKNRDKVILKIKSERALTFAKQKNLVLFQGCILAEATIKDAEELNEESGVDDFDIIQNYEGTTHALIPSMKPNVLCERVTELSNFDSLIPMLFEGSEVEVEVFESKINDFSNYLSTITGKKVFAIWSRADTVVYKNVPKNYQFHVLRKHTKTLIATLKLLFEIGNLSLAVKLLVNRIITLFEYNDCL
jgi:hypothetical protein